MSIYTSYPIYMLHIEALKYYNNIAPITAHIEKLLTIRLIDNFCQFPLWSKHGRLYSEKVVIGVPSERISLEQLLPHSLEFGISNRSKETDTAITHYLWCQ